MSYATATMTSATPAKDLMAALGTQLTAGGMTLVESYGVPGVGVWQSVTYGNGLFVAVATASATAATSADGITWTQRTLPASANWTSVTYGGGQFVAVANGTAAATSPDGITWTARVLPTNTAWSAVTYGGGMYVAVTSNSSANITASSPDGITWTARSVPALAQGWTAVAYGNSRFVAVTSTSSLVITSPDGITWTQRTSQLLSAMVTFGNGLFVAGGLNTATAQTSPDGITWTSRTLPVNSYWSGVTYGGGQFVAVSWSPNVAATSPDGITWTQRTLPGPAGTAWQSVAYGAGTYVATTFNNPSLAAGSSPDAVTWTARAMTATTNTSTFDVYRGPAASNQFGQDWYLILGRISDTSTGLYYQVAEGYNQATHTVSTYGGRGVATVPVAGTYANPLPPLTLDTGVSSVFAANAYLALTTAAFTYWVSANANRVILGVKTSAEAGFYAGLYDDLLPAGVTGFPLVCAKFPTAQTAAAIGGSTLLQAGGFTREPGQAAPAPQALNFEAGIHNGYWAYNNGVGFSAIVPGNFTPMTSTTPLYGNPNSLSRAMIGTARGTFGGVNDGVRGLLIGCVTSAVNSAAGDTTVAGGKTYVRFTGAAATFGFFVDTSL